MEVTCAVNAEKKPRHDNMESATGKATVRTQRGSGFDMLCKARIAFQKHRKNAARDYLSLHRSNRKIGQ